MTDQLPAERVRHSDQRRFSMVSGRAASRLCRLTLAAAVAVSAVSPVHAQFVEPDVEVMHQLVGDRGGEFFGYVANRVGDVNSDGVPDLLFGAPYADNAGMNAGRAYLFSGATGQRLHVFEGVANQYLGAAVNDAGDVNNDGVTDIVLGASGQPFGSAPAFSGRVYVYSGADFSLLWVAPGEAFNDYFGFSVAGLFDDINADGKREVLASAPFSDSPIGLSTGRVYILSGADGSILRSISGAAAQVKLGSAVTSTDDLDGDGLRDFLVGARDAGVGGRGMGYLCSSSGSGIFRSLFPVTSAVDMGYFFCDAIGDADGDGVGDVYMGDFADGARGGATGRAYIHSGSTGAIIRTWTGARAGEGFGIGRGAGDVDLDGRADLFVAAWTGSAGAPGAGTGYVLSGDDGATIRTMSCTIPSANLGFDAFTAGDLDGDGAAEFILTGNGGSPADIAAFNGVAFVIRGIPASCPADFNEDGAVNSQDFFDFLAAFFGSDPSADFNRDKAVNSQDFFDFLAAFFAGCR